MAQAKIELYAVIELSDDTYLPLNFEAFIVSEDCSSKTNPLCVMIYEDRKIIIERKKIREICYERK
jgi:hypothetical protein